MYVDFLDFVVKWLSVCFGWGWVIFWKLCRWCMFLFFCVGFD